MAGSQDEIVVDLNLKFSTDCIVRIFTEFNEGIVILRCYQCISVGFSSKYIVRHVTEVRKSRTPCF